MPLAKRHDALRTSSLIRPHCHLPCHPRAYRTRTHRFCRRSGAVRAAWVTCPIIELEPKSPPQKIPSNPPCPWSDGCIADHAPFPCMFPWRSGPRPQQIGPLAHGVQGSDILKPDDGQLMGHGPVQMLIRHGLTIPCVDVCLASLERRIPPTPKTRSNLYHLKRERQGS
jgi:hypothetical protein